MRLDEPNTMVSKLFLYHFKHRSYHWKTVSLKNAVFDLWWPLTLKRLTVGEICRRSIERAFQELSCAFFGFGVAIIVPEIMAGIPDKTIIFRKFDLWWPLLTSIFTWAKKWPKWLRTGSLRAVDRRIARPSSFPSFRVRGGGVILAPPPPWRRWLRPPPGRGLKHSFLVSKRQHATGTVEGGGTTADFNSGCCRRMFHGQWSSVRHKFWITGNPCP